MTSSCPTRRSTELAGAVDDGGVGGAAGGTICRLVLTPLLVVIVLGAIAFVSVRAAIAGRSQPATTRADSDIPTPAHRLRPAIVLVALVVLLGVAPPGIVRKDHVEGKSGFLLG